MSDTNATLRRRVRQGAARVDEPASGGSPAVPARQPVVRVRNLVKHFKRADGSIVRAIDDVSLEVNAGEFVVLLGPSGCGKTTLLRTIAGLEEPDNGRIDVRGGCQFSSLDGINVPPQRRHLGMIFQSYALWPHMTAFRNVAYPLQCSTARRYKRAEIAERVNQALTMVGIPELSGQYPNQMSGGQQQRVALARALVAGNDLVLFDEPLSNVDAKVREQLRIELLTMQRQLGFAALYVTHDQVEAMELAHQIAVMEAGQVAQLGTPREVYESPGTRYVANFIGTTNEIEGNVASVAPDGRVLIATPFGDVAGVVGTSDLRPGDPVVGVWRPERGSLGATRPSDENCFRGEVEASLFAGPHTEHVVRVGSTSFRLWKADAVLTDEGQSVWVHIPPACLRVLRADEAVAAAT